MSRPGAHEQPLGYPGAVGVKKEEMKTMAMAGTGIMNSSALPSAMATANG